jgi:hypothetical protein
MERLQDMLTWTNQYNLMFLHAYEILQRTPSHDLSLWILADPSTNLRQYNAPSIDEIAVLIPDDETIAANPRDVILHSRSGDLEFIHDHHHTYAPLHYILLFLHGTDGWTYGLHQTEGNRSIIQAQFYSYRLHTQWDQFPILQSSGRLFQQYMCDIWISTDQNRL